jgi:hypothetical protein
MLKHEELGECADEIARLIRKKFPEAELFELGAFLTSSGIFMIANAIPDLWQELKPVAVLSHQLLNQANAETGNKDDRASSSNRRKN